MKVSRTTSRYDNMLEGLQKQLRSFTIEDLNSYIKKQCDILLKIPDNDIEDKNEYLAVWDTILMIDDWFTKNIPPNTPTSKWISVSTWSVRNHFNFMYQYRKNKKP